MELFLLRHAEASHQAPSDELRELTTRGRQQLEAIVRASQSALGGVQAVWVSPYVRAQQTLGAAQYYLPPTVAVTTTPLLTPDQDPLPILQLLAHSNRQSCLLVSHQPLIGTLVNWLCDFAPGEQIMGTSALAALDVTRLQAGGARLRWLRQP